MSEDYKNLTEEEVKQIREILQNEQRAKWLWSSIRVWSIWIAGVITAISITWGTFVEIIRSVVQK